MSEENNKGSDQGCLSGAALMVIHVTAVSAYVQLVAPWLEGASYILVGMVLSITGMLATFRTARGPGDESPRTYPTYAVAKLVARLAAGINKSFMGGVILAAVVPSEMMPAAAGWDFDAALGTSAALVVAGWMLREKKDDEPNEVQAVEGAIS